MTQQLLFVSQNYDHIAYKLLKRKFGYKKYLDNSTDAEAFSAGLDQALMTVGGAGATGG